MSAFVISGDIGPLDPGVRVSFGSPGSGKSYGIKQDVLESTAKGMPVVVVDSLDEWADEKTGEIFFPESHFPIAAGASDIRMVDATVAAGRRLIIYKPRANRIAESVAVCEWALNNPGVGVAIPEAQDIAPTGSIPPAPLDIIATRWRHKRVALWLDTQRPARLSRTMTEIAPVIRVYALTGPRDIEAACDLADDPKALEAALAVCRAKFKAGEPGWHVRFGLDRAPPYTPTRGT